jgi:chromosome segregation ATPase
LELRAQGEAERESHALQLQQRDEALEQQRSESAALRAERERLLQEQGQAAQREATLSSQHQELVQSLASREQAQQALEERLAAQEETVRSLQVALEEERAKAMALETLQAELSDRRGRVASLEQEQELQSHRIHALQQDLAIAKRVADSLRQHGVARGGANETGNVEKLRQDLAQMRKLVEAEQAERNRVVKALSTKESELSALRSRVSDLETELARQSMSREERTPAFGTPHPLLAEIIQLKATILDLQQQHSDVVAELSERLEQVRRDNTELQEAIVRTELEIETQIEQKSQLCAALDSAVKENSELQKRLGDGKRGRPRDCTGRAM